MRDLVVSLRSLVVLTIVTGVVYPLLVTLIAQVVFPWQANGSLVGPEDRPQGSALIGQQFTAPRYFWGRLSATGPYPYNSAASSGSNYGPSNDALVEAATARRDALRAADPENAAPVPVDLVTASGSGLDPEISPAAAAYQLRRVARARGADEARVAALVARYTSGRQLGFLGEPRVNVLRLNLALDAELPAS
jgi:K+-transporting ATPase ATPase C chain